eukprot:gene27574-34317_t
MGQLVHIIYEHGGDIIKFAGDAIICLFTEKKRQVKRRASFSEMIVEDIEHTQSENSFQAILCAMSLREVETDQLTVHVAISCGEICFGILGGYENKWECLVSGECLFELSQCLDDAPSKHVAITDTCISHLNHMQISKLITEKLPSGNHLIRGVVSQGTQSRQASPNTSFVQIKKAAAPRRKKRSVLMYSDVVSQIETLIPSNVIQGLKNKDFGRLAELREVTTMFMKWESYDSETHKDLVSLQRYYVSAQEILSKSGAFIRQFLVDDKGCVLIACWGVPTCSYFDNAHRALSSAVAMRNSFNRMDMRVSIGITTGNVYCGCVGSIVRREYAVIGDVVNLSARLMSKAHGGIYIDEHTFGRLPGSDHGTLQSLPPIQVKGKSEPMNIYSFMIDQLIRSPSDMPVTEVDVRAASKRILTTHLDNMLRRDNTHASHNLSMQTLTHITSRFTKQDYNDKHNEIKFILIEGNHGTGKIKTVKWFRQVAKDKDIRTVLLRFDKKECMEEYSGIAKLFRLLVSEDVFDNPERQAVYVKHILKEIYGHDREKAEKIAFPVMRMTLGVKCSITYTTDAASLHINKLQQRLMNEALFAIFSFLLRSQPIAVVLERADCIDEQSMRVILTLASVKELKSVIVFVAQPPEESFEQTLLTTEMQSTRNKTPTIGNSSSRFFSGSIVAEPTNEWFGKHRDQMLSLDNTTHIVLLDYSVKEIEEMVLTTLQLSKAPPGLALMIFNLSSGNPYWVGEMLEFIKTTGAAGFIKSMSNTRTRKNEHQKQQAELDRQVMAFASPKTSFINFGGLSGRSARSKPASVSPTADSSPVTPTGSSSHNRSFFNRRSITFSLFPGTANRSAPYGVTLAPLHRGSISSGSSTTNGMSNRNSGKNGALSRLRSSFSAKLGFGNIPAVSVDDYDDEGHSVSTNQKKNTKSKLELFVVCRFECLNTDDQKILRSASIIGFRFSRYVLYGILSKNLKSEMYSSLKSLEKHNWIRLSDNNDSEYVFNHSILHDTIYDLTPSSDRQQTHLAIAEYVEEVYTDDPTQFSTLRQHYALCNPLKALEYSMRTALYLLKDTKKIDFEQILVILKASVLFCKCSADINVLLKVTQRISAMIIKVQTKIDVLSKFSEALLNDDDSEEDEEVPLNP